MPSVIYNSLLFDLARGNVDFDSDVFKVLLVGSGYVPDVKTHTRRSHVTNEIVASGYTAGGLTLAATVTLDTANNRVNVGFATVTWATATIVNARGAVIYKSRGGAASADELVAYADFGSNRSSGGGGFEVSFPSPIRIAQGA